MIIYIIPYLSDDIHLQFKLHLLFSSFHRCARPINTTYMCSHSHLNRIRIFIRSRYYESLFFTNIYARLNVISILSLQIHSINVKK